ncbi:ATP-binding cassette domain-containing protein [Anaerorhabdus sp.]|uniref:ATP-binding cassette domain-containing protein n=1 Tax=Anaerorhabdus sp. TaxID=1872524 RepID=UPI002B211880|nr:ATP-binding cassette domain-containing protein [Anaerorhabdus sp.]MEA4875199.1 ATP-binding cassette domain-containing protein [Anaerorhabdus sp.]
MNESPILKVSHFYKQFGPGCDTCRNNPDSLEGNYCPKCKTVYACNDINLELYEGEILGVVGESGSGKSTLVQCLYFDKEPSHGEYTIVQHKDGNKNIFEETDQQKRMIRNTVLGMVYQNPYLGLKMNFSAISNIAEKLIAANHLNVEKMTTIGTNLLEKVNIPEYRMKDCPKNFSGGMQQRVQIAKALSNNPPILLLDEVTTGLDLSVQANVLDLIKQIQRESKVSMIVVSHDLGVIKMLADRTIVMLNGRIVEEGLTDQIMEDPQHPYTQQLVYSLL